MDGCDCEEVLQLIEQGRIDTTPLITHRFPLSRIEEAYRIFENKEDGVIKIAVFNGYDSTSAMIRARRHPEDNWPDYRIKKVTR